MRTVTMVTVPENAVVMMTVTTTDTVVVIVNMIIMSRETLFL